MLFPAEIRNKAQQLVDFANKKSAKLATAESCTGGLLAALITDISGASKVFDRGFVTYSNRSKIEQLTVPSYFIEEYGAVSRETAIAMAEGTLLVTRADIAVSITGIAGPEGGTDEKPVGTVYIALSDRKKGTQDKHFLFSGDRDTVRQLSVEAAIELFLSALS